MELRNLKSMYQGKELELTYNFSIFAENYMQCTIWSLWPEMASFLIISALIIPMYFNIMFDVYVPFLDGNMGNFKIM